MPAPFTLKNGSSPAVIRANAAYYFNVAGMARARAWAEAYEQARKWFVSKHPGVALPLHLQSLRKGNPAGRPKSANSMTPAQRQAKYRATHLPVKTSDSITATVKRLAVQFDMTVPEVTRALLQFALCNRKWSETGFPGSRRRNPAPALRSNEIEKGAKLYEDFSGHEAEEIGKVDKPTVPDVLVCIGEADGIMYSTVRDGQLERYVHEFKARARPLFCVSPDGTALFFIGGSYDFTERGIIDR